MSLWTPSGEHNVPRETPTAAGSGDDWRERLMAGELTIEDLTSEQRAEVEEAVAEMAESQRQLLQTPIEHLIAQHIIGLRELAILHLQQEAPDFVAAQAAIDAVAGIVEGVGDRMGELAEPLRLDVTNLQMAFVSRKAQVEGEASPTPG